jgi:phospho-N-acetylmuramoyl-pentapeptide-transferase
MLYLFFKSFTSDVSIFNVFKYITFRTGISVITSLVFILLVGENLISKLKKFQKHGQPIRDDGPLSHIIKKSGTPTMGGLIIILSILFSTLLWADLTNKYVLILVFCLLSFGAIGFIDDYLKVVKNNSKGISAKLKLFLQILSGVIVIYLIILSTESELNYKIYFPLLKKLVLDIGIFYFIFGLAVIVGSSNAVNLTDGLDGLAIVPVILVAVTFTLIAYLSGNIVFAKYLQLTHIKNAGEICIFLGSMTGAGLGFLWFNSPPAKVFMGDTGSLSLGAALGAIGIITKHEIVLAVVSGLFVLESLSVIIQVASFKLTGKRVFQMAPLHHHFEKKGWSESTVVIRFWIIAIVFALIGLASLKLR